MILWQLDIFFRVSSFDDDNYYHDNDDEQQTDEKEYHHPAAPAAHNHIGTIRIRVIPAHRAVRITNAIGSLVARAILGLGRGIGANRGGRGNFFGGRGGFNNIRSRILVCEIYNF